MSRGTRRPARIGPPNAAGWSDWRLFARRRSEGDQGSVLVEFALVLPIFAVMLFGMIQFGLVFNGWTSLRNSAQTGVGLAALDELGSDTSCQQGQEALNANPPVNPGTAALLCSIAGFIGQPTGTTGSPDIDLLVQNGVVTVCAQVGAQPFTGFFPAMTLSTTSSVYVQNPPAASLAANFHDPTIIHGDPGGNDTLTYQINGDKQTATIVDGMYTTPSSLATAVQNGISLSNPPTNMQLQVSSVGNSIELEPSPPDVAEVVFQVSGSAVSAGALDFSGVTSADNNFVENYNPDALQNCTALTVSAPTTAFEFSSIDPAATLPGSNTASTGTISFTVFGPQGTAPTDCTTGGIPVGTADVTMGDYTYPSTSSYTPTSPGDYWWYASYSGDPDNDPADSVCGSGMEETVVSPPPPP